MWSFQTLGADGSTHVLRLPAEGTVYLTRAFRDPLTSGVELVQELQKVGHIRFGRITVRKFGAKLEAIDSTLRISPGSASSNPTTKQPNISYELQAGISGRTEILILRHGDVITSGEFSGRLTCSWTSSEVQVTSSAADVDITTNANGADGVFETPEEEKTEDEDLDDINNTITAVEATQSKSQHADTPQLSNERSVVVQETPTAARINVMENDAAIPRIEFSEGKDHPQPLEITPTPEPMDCVEVEPYSTARTGQSQNGGQKPHDGMLEDIAESGLDRQEFADDETLLSGPKSRQLHPKVSITRKRPSPAFDETDISGRKRPMTTTATARFTSEDETQDSRLSTIVVDIPPAAGSASKNRKRKSVASEEFGDATPSRSQRSQRSTTAPDAEPYEGETPRVATSNSSIVANSQGVKFLKKQGGSLIESVKDPFNILCIRDGDLHKTPKVLQAIAAGTPIVTDKWLTDSAKAGHFLSVEAYKPFARKKEREWKFDLRKVLGAPQTPFDGYTMQFTTNLHSIYKPFTEIEQVCKAAGADKVTKKKIDKSEKVIVLAVDETDKEAEKLMADGVTCYHRDLIPMSIFRGVLDLDSDEFKISAETKKKRGRKG